ncbi:hypothetical protein GCM10017044_16710 [Kordiimonas sediminis]|uniref:Peptidase M56 domain-containing protein n=1 Tax=Kordiimonas sediminis TaxID=1735581 RepID=A0A919E7Z3_9PROT|nr:M56 family metallopeptidase [Kordiimonas sediminis]GHF22970.1 hypothetical protein GCM10017044_16710 [Kordiimonas sediminis]
MIDFILDTPLIAGLFRFLIGSTIFLGGVYLLERASILKTVETRETCWRAAVLASLLTLTPTTVLAPLWTITNPDVTGFIQSLEQDRPLGRFMPVSEQQRTWTTAAYETATQSISDPLENTEGTPGPTSEEPTIQNRGTTATLPAEYKGAQRPSQETQLMTAYPPGLKTSSEFSTSVLFSHGWVHDISSAVLITAAWCLIGAASLLLLAFGYRRAIRSLGTRTNIETNHQAYQTLTAICQKGRIRSIPNLSTSDRIKSPVCLPAREICLPEWALNPLPEREMQSLLAHEVAHMIRRDPVMLICMQFLSSLCFFQPLFKVAQQRLVDLAELSADAWAAKHVSDAHAVASALYTCASKITKHDNQQWGLAMSGHKSILKYRIESLLAKNKTRPASKITRTGIATGVVVAAFAVPNIQFANALSAPFTDKDKEWEVVVAPTPPEVVTPVAPTGAALEAIVEAPMVPEFPAVSTSSPRFVVSNAVVSGNKISVSASESNASSYAYAISEGDETIETNITFNGNNGALNWVTGNESKKAAWKGSWSLNADETMIVFLEEGGAFGLETEDGDSKQEIEFITNNGTIIKEFRIDGKPHGFDAKAQEWFHSNIVFILRETGYNAKERVSRFLKKGGADAVLHEMEFIEGGWAIKTYAEALTAQTSLSNKQVDRLIDKLSTLDSDYEMRTAFTNLLTKADIPAKSRQKVWKAAENIDSDYELRMLLTPFAQSFDMQNKDAQNFLSLAQSIDSDYELRQLLEEGLASAELSDRSLTELAKVASEIESDYEYRKLLQAFATKLTSHKSAMQIVLAGIDDMDSDFERRQLIEALECRTRWTLKCIRH